MADLDQRYDVDHRYQAFEDHQTGLLISAAGPGTGKTYSFLRRASALISTGRAAPNAICYLAFIKEIARAFDSDYTNAFGDAGGANARPRVSTLHSLACRLLRNRGFSIGYDGPLYFAALTSPTDQSAVFLADMLPLLADPQLNTAARVAAAFGSIKSAWQANNDPLLLPSPIPALLHVYLVLALAFRLVDWDFAIPLAHSLYNNPLNRQDWLTRLDHYFIDEYQDFNPSEQSFLASIAENCTSMVVVGDPNQSIYRQRSALPLALTALRQAPAADSVSLLRCRRCRANILQASNTLLRILDPASIPLLPNQPDGEITCLRFKSTKAEIAFLRDFLTDRLAHVPEDAGPNESIACLFPTKRALEFYLGALRADVPAFTRATSADPSRARLALHLQLVCNPQQRFIQRLLLEDFPAVQTRDKRKMVRFMLLNDDSPPESLSRLAQASLLSQAAPDAAAEFRNYCRQLESGDPDTIAAAISSRLGHDRGLLADTTRALFIQLQTTDQERAIEAYCDTILPQTAQLPQSPRTVQFLTIHGSKGLTRKAIIMPGLEDAWLPGQAAGEDLDERRRVFYVAITRATDEVLITYPTHRGRQDPLNYDTPGRAEPSRFVVEAAIRHSYHP